MNRPKRIKRVIRCEVCKTLKRLAKSSRVWVEEVNTSFLTGNKTVGGYAARICIECRSSVGYKGRKKTN